MRTIRVALVLLAGLMLYAPMAALAGPDDRQERRDERGRSDERQDRRDCRQEEGWTGEDKRECKQEEVRDGVRGRQKEDGHEQ